MATRTQDTSCMLICWAVAALLGVLTAIGLMTIGWSPMQGIFMGVLALVVVGAVLSFGMCGMLESPGDAAERMQREMAEARDGLQGNAPAQAAAPAAAPAAPKPAPAKPVAKAAPVAETPEPEVAEAPAPASEPEPAPEPVSTGAATQPAGLDAPRGGGADDLKKIKGVGPALEKQLNGLGYYHFDQIAAWTADEVAWVDDNLIRFKGRVSRDNWVDQAKTLAAGEDTDFSKRVDDGDVY